ncbi:hypothetical protein CQA81_31405, partial [Klebsiella pneumoniae]
AEKAQADCFFTVVGIPLTWYGEDEGTERLIPFDMPGGNGFATPINSLSGQKKRKRTAFSP